MIRREWIKAKAISLGSLENIKTAWETSRPADTNPEMKKVLSMDVPVNDANALRTESTDPHP